LAYFGLGHYIYAGEDMPRFLREEAIKKIEKHDKENDGYIDKIKDHFKVDKIESLDDLKLELIIDKLNNNKETA